MIVNREERSESIAAGRRRLVKGRAIRRRGYILIAVLGLAAIVTTMGLSFINAHATVAPMANNRFRAARARYLAESAAAVATHYLMVPPTTVSGWDSWTGTTGLSIDATSDFADVAVVQDGADPYQYTITATGVAHDFDGVTVLAKHTITAQVLRSRGGKWRIPYAYLATSNTWIPSTAHIDGDLHANGSLAGQARCENDITATGAIAWSSAWTPSSITPGADAFVAPPVNAALYTNYSIKGENYTAYTSWPYNDIYRIEAETLNAQDWSATNPGRIIVVKSGDFILQSGVALNGTLVVQGNLLVQSGTAAITAVPDYPALVVTGNIGFRSANTTLRVTGSVLCGGLIEDGGRAVNMRVTGACIVRGGFDTVGSGDTFQFTWNAERAEFWDFAVSGDLNPITLLSWKEN